VIELSVKETNELRADLGLKPLRMESNNKKNNENNKNDNDNNSSRDKNTSSEELSLSVKESNRLRLKLGLAPLRDDTNSNDDGNHTNNSGKKQSDAIHMPASNLGSEEEATKRIEKAKLKRDVEAGLQNLVGSTTNNNNNNDPSSSSQENVMDWAAKMRSSTTTNTQTSTSPTHTTTTTTKKKKKKKIKRSTMNQMSIPQEEEEEEEAGVYTEQNLKGLKVSHDVSDFGEGSTTILTLADHSIFEYETNHAANNNNNNNNNKKAEDMNRLENVNMVDDSKGIDNLKRKRDIEMGMGHAGGYAGYDDEEFEELGGAQMSISTTTDNNNNNNTTHQRNATKKRDTDDNGFMIGSTPSTTTAHASSNNNNNNNDDNKESDIFSHERGNAVDLTSSSHTKNASSSIMDPNLKSQTEFLTHEEDLEYAMAMKKQQQKEDKRRRKEEKKQFQKSKKSKTQKSKQSINDNPPDGTTTSKSILDALESSATAPSTENNNATHRNAALRKRRSRNYDSSDEEDDDATMTNTTKNNTSKQPTNPNNTTTTTEEEEDKESLQLQRRKVKFDRAVDKGNQRTAMIFASNNKVASSKSKNSNNNNNNNNHEMDDGEEDDAFLSAALAKARRLHKLRQLNSKVPAPPPTLEDTTTTSSSSSSSNNNANEKGANAVVQSMQRMNEQQTNGNRSNDGSSSANGVTFEYDETREFTRALRARTDKLTNHTNTKKGIQFHTSKVSSVASDKKKHNVVGADVGKNDATTTTTALEDNHTSVKSEEEEPENLEELSKQIRKDDPTTANGNLEEFGSTANARPVGRGLANVLSMLKHTGEITGKNAGKEEMRGRAKDKRTYEDYAPLDLTNVVKIDKTGGIHGIAPNAKDLEFAEREINLEYRDEHGRLLTRKEAYRNLCYAFHGYGSSKRNQERKLKQIEREREANLTVSKMLGETNDASQGGGGGSSHTSGGQGTFGALKATQRATGKAFVVHKI